MIPRVRIRGIYVTALTALLSGRGFPIADPSATIRGRFFLPWADGPADVLLDDRRDRHGVVLTGPASAVEQVRAALAQALPDALFAQAEGPTPVCTTEFPATVKSRLDAIRAGVLPTLPGHHRLKVIDAGAVDQAEMDLAWEPSWGSRLARDLVKALVYDTLGPGAPFEIDHVKAGGPAIRMGGTIHQARQRRGVDEGTVELARFFKAGGCYDTLGDLISPGDYGTITLHQGAWTVRRQYFRQDGELIGELYNVNTPVEIYPGHARYIDLEVDVAFRPPQDAAVVDMAELQRKVDSGLIPAALGEEASRRAEELAAALTAGGGWAAS